MGNGISQFGDDARPAPPDSSDEPIRHSATVRITHWINAAAFLGLVISGIAILLAHPRLYWGETGGVGSASLIDLPLPFMLTGQSGWGRSLHFLAAWVCVLNGLYYVVYGFVTRHFAEKLVPAGDELRLRAIRSAIRNSLRRNKSPQESHNYNALQRTAYLTVVFFLFPLMIWTGLAMSPAVTSVVPVLVTALGGQQSARTLHFFAAMALVIFLGVHVAMVSRSGFATLMIPMLKRRSAGEFHADSP